MNYDGRQKKKVVWVGDKGGAKNYLGDSKKIRTFPKVR